MQRNLISRAITYWEENSGTPECKPVWWPGYRNLSRVNQALWEPEQRARPPEGTYCLYACPLNPPSREIPANVLIVDQNMAGETVLCTETYGTVGEEVVYLQKDPGYLQVSNTKSNSSWSFRGLEDLFKSVFLPQGYPDSVSKDYLKYQIWDSIQAFVSRLMGTLSTQAVLKGIGVGDEYATPLAATITWLLRDGTNNLSRILFTWYQSTSLDYNSKQWRLYADAMNDVAFCFDLIAAHAGFLSTPVLCLAGVCRATVEAAGGATRAAFIQHQARRDNLADVAAKDGSQETLVNLAGLIASFAIVPLVGSNPILMWFLFLILTSLHLFANYKAVRAVSMETLNQLRLFILVRNFLENPQRMPSLEEVNCWEPVTFGINRDRIYLGCSFGKTVDHVSNDLKLLQTLYADGDYFLTFDAKAHEVFITLRKGCSSFAQIESSFQANFLLYYLRNPEKMPAACFIKTEAKSASNRIVKKAALLRWSREYTKDNFPAFLKILEVLGWETSRTLLGCDEWRTEWKL